VPGYALHHYSYAEKIVTLQEIKTKERQERNRFKGYCKQSALNSKIMYSMAS
jgi:hypothetical protein